MKCIHLRKMTARVHEPLTEVYGCSQFGSCTLTPSTLKSKGEPLANCETCPLFAALGEQEFTAIASSTSPTGFTWDCTPAQLQRIGFLPLSAGDVLTLYPQPEETSAEPVGDELHKLLDEIGIRRSGCPVCAEWQQRMNRGVRWCTENRAAILGRLNEQAKTASWVEALSAGRKGFWTTAAILDEAIRRASA